MSLLFYAQSRLLSLAGSGGELQQRLEDGVKELEGLSRQAGDTRTALQAFSEALAEHETELKSVSSSLEQIEQLDDILELPKYAAACLAKEDYGRVIDLAFYAQRLFMWNSNNPLVRDIVDFVHKCSNAAVTAMIRCLETHLDLPSVIKAVNTIRRTNSITDVELRLIILKGKAVCLAKDLSALSARRPKTPSSADTAAYLRSYLDIVKDSLVQLVSQYRALFLEDFRDATSASAVTPRTSPSSMQSAAANFGLWLDCGYSIDGHNAHFAGNALVADALPPQATVLDIPGLKLTAAKPLHCRLFFSYLTHTLKSLEAQIAANIPKIDSLNQLQSVHAHAQYCSAALNRIGLDFMPILERFNKIDE